MSDALHDVCITCGDVAVDLVVVSVEGSEARCVDAHGATEVVAVDLVGPLRPGDHVLAHAGIALTRLEIEGGEA
jgi:hydrogenase maturation factor